MSNSPLSFPSAVWRTLAGTGIWLLGWLLLFVFAGRLDLANLALLLIMASALAATCLPARAAVLLALASVLGFDWFFIPPHFAFKVDVHQHLIMLLVMLVVNLVIISLMAARRVQLERAARHAAEAQLLRLWGDELHEANDPGELKDRLQALLTQITGVSVSLLVLRAGLPERDEMDAVWLLGEANLEQRHALWHCLRNSQQLGRGTGYYELFFDVYLPLRARGQALGAVLLQRFDVQDFATRVHLQTICDQFGSALARHRVQQAEEQSREQIQVQALRNQLLAAISHDYRTPLATIIGAATSLQTQHEKLSAAQSQQLAQRIEYEADRLNSITSNILQLARLDGSGAIACDWQSAEEIMGDLLRRWRARGQAESLHIQLQPQLPLLWCDALLVGQLLENLVDNALKYSPADTQVHIHCCLRDKAFVLSVADAGPGIPTEQHERIFLPFQRGNGVGGSGAGLGLALCRAIAQAHQGDLQLREAEQGGACFEFTLPFVDMPADKFPPELTP